MPACVTKAPYLEAIVQEHQIYESVCGLLVVARGKHDVGDARIVPQCGDLRVDTETCNYRQHAACSAENMEVLAPGEVSLTLLNEVSLRGRESRGRWFSWTQ